MIDSSAQISSDAVVAESAQVDAGVFIGEGCKIGKNVTIGRNSIVEAYTEIGENTCISPNVHIGGAPQDIGFNNEATRLIIGKNCTIREFSTIHRASTKEDRVTEIGDNCYIMATSHIGHDCKVGNNVIITSFVGLSGHVQVGDSVVFGGMAGIHQFVRIGKGAMIGGFSRIAKDVPPFCLAEGNPAKIHGLNSVGLRRGGFKREQLSNLKKVMRIFLNKEYLIDDAINEIVKLSDSAEVKEFAEFLRSSKRGVLRR
ncbi:MAG: acyl-ACP--UDP-N-acetylglucosamine O-acyltransferase [Flexistipes sinusarabici]|uniref:Acyl-ACP--UDP-N-acetylglucosamine O-acyltransferase n=1 Tax=Flexistipes sinusarabici TaxID=2352 RepID=A0A5D0MU17_FLESI|nr:acyl-ACP--UDP-N-acetylglucosamine O-acyltransferase [Flexistipes sinusarabici]TYB35630.1 MAG: acyl-ACP--UDP-N-acetylglucosamine O-acyltransferase [Flexistipes sinusarabici]